MAVFDDVLCAVDGTRGGYEGVRQAASLLGPGGRLKILAVAGGRPVDGRSALTQAAIAPQRARRVLDYAARLANGAGVQAEIELDERGPVPRLVLEHAREHRLLALGAPAMSRLAHLLIGGVATGAAHALPASLLVARRPPAGAESLKRIIVASDALQPSERLVDFAMSLALERDAELLVLHAARAESRFQPTRIANQAARVAGALGERGRMEVEHGGATEVIVRKAGRERASLVVLSSRRVGGLRALGSVSERVVHAAPCSVLVMRPDDLRE
jgi:nucleotide-binding universal stress UspA family protein